LRRRVGIAVGLFGGWPVAAMDAAKMPLVGFCSLLLCFPSLYVFSCVAGMPLTLPQTCALGSACFAMMGLILVGLAPSLAVRRVHVQSRIRRLVGVPAVARGHRLRRPVRRQAARRAPLPAAGRLKLWFAILLLVTLQMATCMRPMLAPPGERGWFTSEKQFFLAHFGHALNGTP
jgi:hypothetical protein